MPYNNTAIPPTPLATGSSALPLARVKRMLQVDEDINQCSNNAAFLITFATELFVYHLAEQSHNAAKADSKPRRNVQYKDVASVVARYDNLEFLADVVPRTVTYRQYKEKKATKEASKATRSLPTGQTTINGKHPGSSQMTEQINPSSTTMDDGTVSSEEGSRQTDMAQPANGVPANVNLVFEHYEPNGNTKHDESSDIEMQ